MKKMRKLLKNQKGLTLIELLAVIVILAIVAAIAVPAIGNIITNSRDKAILADASMILSGAKLAATDGSCTAGAKSGEYTCSFEQLNGKFVSSISKLKAGADAKYTVTKVGDDWTVALDSLTDLSDNTNYTTIKSAKKVTEKELNEALKK